MNERIRELAKQCTSWSEGSTWTSREVFDKEKFAELIVRECVLHLHRRGVEGFGILEERNLKEYFGVEE